jgi:hypothetical protein
MIELAVALRVHASSASRYTTCQKEGFSRHQDGAIESMGAKAGLMFTTSGTHISEDIFGLLGETLKNLDEKL